MPLSGWVTVVWCTGCGEQGMVSMGDGMGHGGLAQVSDDVPLRDNEILDEFTIPFGSWIAQIFDWFDDNARSWFDAVGKPFGWAADDLLFNHVTALSWTTVALVVLLICWIQRGLYRSVGCAAALAGCGLLGDQLWFDTVFTLGQVVLSALVVVVVGYPVAALLAMWPAGWPRVRAVLDNVQLWHVFLAALPGVMFFGTGPGPAMTLVTFMMLPVFVRIVVVGLVARNTDRPGLQRRDIVLLGVNQITALALTVTVIYAIIGAYGLPRLIFRSFASLDVAQAFAGGVALAVVATVLHTMTTPAPVSDVVPLGRLEQAYANRTGVEYLIAGLPDRRLPRHRRSTYATPRTSPTHVALIIVGAATLVGSMFVEWNSDAGWVSGFARRLDESLPGRSFDGFAAEGGSFFGMIALVGALIPLALIGSAAVGRGKAPAWCVPRNALIASLVATLVPLALVVSGGVPDSGLARGAGPWVACVGGLVAVAGSFAWVRVNPPQSARLGPQPRAKRRMLAAVLGLVLVWIGSVSGWAFDFRADSVITPEVQEEIDRLSELGRTDPANAATYAADISAMMARVQRTGVSVTSGVSSEGPGFGTTTRIIAIAVVALSIATRHRTRWPWQSLIAGLGLSVAAIGAGWILSVLRVGDSGYVSGAGAFITVLAGVLIFVAHRPRAEPAS